MSQVINLFQYTLLFAAPLLIVALAGCFAEKSGVINLALEGGMIIGAFGGAAFVFGILTANEEAIFALQEADIVAYTWLQQGLFLGALLVAGIVGAIFSLLLSLAAIKFKCDQTIAGTALNLLAPAILLTLCLIIMNQEKLQMPATYNFVLVTTQNPGTNLLEIFTNKIYISTYICIALFIFLSIWMYKSKTGTHLRACGEHPQAAESVGINVKKMRYLGTTLSGFLAGLGGYAYIAGTSNGCSESTIGGMGFLALAIMIFGNWNPLTIGLGALLFGFLKCVGPLAGQKGFFLEPLHIPTLVYNMIPYIIVLVVLVVARKRNGCPKAEGIPYDKGMR